MPVERQERNDKNEKTNTYPPHDPSFPVVPDIWSTNAVSGHCKGFLGI